MSNRSHILDGTKTANLYKSFGLIYTCNAGWIDLGHLDPGNPRIEIGAANLWKQILAEGKPAIDPKCGPAPSYLNNIGTIAHSLSRPGGCKDDSNFRFPDRSTGYLVHYRQDHAAYPGKPGREGRYLVRHGLSLERKKQVALAIYMEVSIRFENFQSLLGRIRLTNSGYSREDLVSNLVGFYIGIGEVSRRNAFKACHPTSDITAFAIWDRDGAVGENKNSAWHPLLARSIVVDNGTTCTDECMGQPKKFPDIFQRINPAKKGEWFIELPIGYR